VFHREITGALGSASTRDDAPIVFEPREKILAVSRLKTELRYDAVKTPAPSMKTAERFSQSLPDGLEIRAKAVLLFVKAEVQLHDRALEIADSLSETSAEAELVDRLNCGDDLPLFTADRHLKRAR